MTDVIETTETEEVTSAHLVLLDAIKDVGLRCLITARVLMPIPARYGEAMAYLNVAHELVTEIKENTLLVDLVSGDVTHDPSGLPDVPEPPEEMEQYREELDSLLMLDQLATMVKERMRAMSGEETSNDA